MPVDRSRYLDLFVVESREHLVCAEGLTHSLADPSAPNSLRDLFRHAHSIKGMAAAMGYTRIASLAHAAEDVLDVLRSGRAADPAPYAPPLRDAFACMARMVERAGRGEPAQDPAAQSTSLRLRMAVARASSQMVGDHPAPPSPLQRAPGNPVRETASVETRWRLDLVLAGPADAPTVSIMKRLMDALSRLGTVRAEGPPALDPRAEPPIRRMALQLSSSRGGHDLVLRLSEIPEIVSFVVRGEVALPLDRSASPSPPRWVRVRTETLDRLIGAARVLASGEEDRLARGRLAQGILTDALDLRVPRFDLAADRMDTVLGQVTDSLGKQARLEVEGREVRLDRVALEALLETLPHLVRNAVHHGIESPDERLAKGKPAEGVVRVRVQSLGREVAIAVEDDGRGMRVRSIRRSVLEMGLADRETLDALSDAEILQFLGQTGLTTSSAANRVSGRGVGLDVVKARIEALGGTIDLSTEEGRGTRVAIRIPTPVAILDALLVRCAGTVCAIPRTSVVRVVERRVWCVAGKRECAVGVDEILGTKEIAVACGEAWVLYDGSAVRLLELPTLTPVSPPEDCKTPSQALPERKTDS